MKPSHMRRFSFGVPSTFDDQGVRSSIQPDGGEGLATSHNLLFTPYLCESQLILWFGKNRILEPVECY